MSEKTGHGKDVTDYICRETDQLFIIPQDEVTVISGESQSGRRILYRSVVECPKHKGEYKVADIDTPQAIGLMTNGAAKVRIENIDEGGFGPISAQELDLIIAPPSDPPSASTNE